MEKFEKENEKKLAETARKGGARTLTSPASLGPACLLSWDWLIQTRTSAAYHLCPMRRCPVVPPKQGQLSSYLFFLI